MSGLIEQVAPVASYVTLNISSPNTPGLRELQRASAVDDLLARVVEARDRVAPRAGPTPVLLKIAPDLSLADLDDIVGVARARKIDGMIVGNTTIGRPPALRDRATARQAGGLSGRPLYPLATRMLAETYVRVEGAFPLIGVGGIDSGAAALGKIRAGADLVQLYSALVYRGFALVGEIKAALSGALDRGDADKLSDLVGVDAAAMTAEKWPARCQPSVPSARERAAGSARSGSRSPRRAGNTARASARHRSPCSRCRGSAAAGSTKMFSGSSPSADSTTPIRIDSRMSLPSTASGGPPRKRLTLSAMRISRTGRSLARSRPRRRETARLG